VDLLDGGGIGDEDGTPPEHVPVDDKFRPKGPCGLPRILHHLLL
jgi:hypothetical protein